MTPEQLLARIERGEDSHQQFKRDITGTEMLAAELCAFSNSDGGLLLIGVDDDGSVFGLEADDVARLNQLLSNTASQSVRPSITPATENVVLPEGIVMVVRVDRGENGPYMDNKGRIYVKSGADKRQVTDPDELQRMFQRSGLFNADEIPITDAWIGQLDVKAFRHYYESRYGETLGTSEDALLEVLENLNLARENQLNLSGLLLFGHRPQAFRAAFVIKVVRIVVDEEGVERRETVDIEGPLPWQFQRAMHLLQRYTVGDAPAIPVAVFEQFIVNALLHRDYYIHAPVRVLVYADRVEVVSPGHLPNHLNTTQIRHGLTSLRNPTLYSHAIHLLPYAGPGTGIRAAIKSWRDIGLIDDRDNSLFRVIIRRPPLEG